MAQPPLYTRYYTYEDLGRHRFRDDCWVTFLGKVYDLTDVIAHNEPRLVQQLIDNAGTDISSWFNATTGDLLTHVDVLTGLETYVLPNGKPLLHADQPSPSTNVSPAPLTPWWHDESLCVGCMTSRARAIRIINTLTGDEHKLLVCCEDTLGDIASRYAAYNSNCAAYEWRYLGHRLDMQRTLEANGIRDEHDEEQDCLVAEQDRYIPGITLVYRDSLV